METIPMQSLQVVYRATVMVGTLIVGALAYRAYGPQLEKLAPVVSRVQELAAAWLTDTDAVGDVETDAPSAPPANLMTETLPLTPAEPPRLLDANVQQAASWETGPPTPAAAEDHSPVTMVVRALNDLGVTEYSLTPWGDRGQAYRFHCSAPWGHEGRYSRQFEAIAADPAQAAEKVLAEVKAWHTTKR